MKSKYKLPVHISPTVTGLSPRRKTRTIFIKSGLVVDKYYYSDELRVDVWKFVPLEANRSWVQVTELEVIPRDECDLPIALNDMRPYTRETVEYRY